MLKKLFIYFAALAGCVLFFLIFVLVFVNSTEITCVQQPDQTYTCQRQTYLLGKFPTFHKRLAKAASRREQRKKSKAETKTTKKPGSSRGNSKNPRWKSLIVKVSFK